MLNKCVKLILILALVVAVAFGVSFLPFSLSDKFKQVAEKVTSHIKGLAGLNKNAGAKLNLDFSKRDNYKLGEFNVVFDKVNNVPKEGFHKFVHKGENDATLDVEKFFNGETELEGLEGGLFDYAAAYFKGDTPHLLLVELALHEEENKANADNAGEKKEGEAKGGENKENAAAEEKKGQVMFFAPGENNKWVKLPEGANLGEKVEEVFNALSAAAAAAPANATPEGGNGAPAGGAPPAEGPGAPAGPGEGPAAAGGQAGGNAVPPQGPATPVPAPGPKTGGDGAEAKAAAPAPTVRDGGALGTGAGPAVSGAGAGQGHGNTGAKGDAGPAVSQGTGVGGENGETALRGAPGQGTQPGTENQLNGGNTNGNNHGGQPNGGTGHGGSNGGGSSVSSGTTETPAQTTNTDSGNGSQ